MQGWVKAKNAAKFCDVSERTVRTWLKEGLPFIKVKGTVLIKIEKLDAYLMGFENNENEIENIVNEVTSCLGR